MDEYTYTITSSAVRSIMLFLYIQAVANERSYVIRNSDRRSIPQ
jgi:hypothetical protein